MESIFSFLDSPQGSSCQRQLSVTSVTSDGVNCRVSRFSETSSSDFGSNELVSTKCETVYKRSVSHTVQNFDGFLDLSDHNGTLVSSENNITSLARTQSKRNTQLAPPEFMSPHRLQTSRKTWAFFPRVTCSRCKDFLSEDNHNRSVCFCKDSLDKHHDEVWLSFRKNSGVGSSDLRTKDDLNKSTDSGEDNEEESEADEDNVNKSKEEDKKHKSEDEESSESESEEEDDDSEDDDSEDEDYIVEEVDDTDASSSLSSEDDYRSCVEVEELPPD